MKVLMVSVFFYICCMHIDQIKADNLITYYDHENGGGQKFTLNLQPSSCYQLSFFNNRIGSIKTNGNCVHLYDDQDCKGDFRTIETGIYSYSNMADVGFDDRTSSLMLC